MIGKQKITALMAIAMMMLSPFSGFAESTPYAVFNSNTGTLTFKYGDKTTDVSGTVYDLNGFYPAWREKNSNITNVVFADSFKDARPNSCLMWFYKCDKLTTISGIENLNTSEVTDMRSMFYECSALTELNLSNFNTEKVTSMREMFEGCKTLTTLDLSNFNNENVQDMSFMFDNCESLNNLNLSQFNPSI